jgi:hypothetical protein
MGGIRLFTFKAKRMGELQRQGDISLVPEVTFNLPTPMLPKLDLILNHTGKLTLVCWGDWAPLVVPE